MPQRQRRASLPKIWERGYARAHNLWAGRTKLGSVVLDNGSYRWQAAYRTGEESDLVRAKAAVEAAIDFARVQLELPLE